MFYGITNLSTFVVGAVIIVLLPGPNSLYVMSVASRAGVAAAYRGACGIFLGDGILMFASAMGIASLLRAVPALFLLVKFVGAAYLAWMGIRLLRASRQGWLARQTPTAEPPRQAGDTQPFQYVSARLLEREGARFRSERNALAELPELRLVQFLFKFGLPGKHNLQQLLGRSFQVGQQPNFFQHPRREVLGLIDN